MAFGSFPQCYQPDLCYLPHSIFIIPQFNKRKLLNSDIGLVQGSTTSSKFCDLWQREWGMRNEKWGQVGWLAIA